MKYLLSTGNVTESRERYIVDLFRLNMQILPREVPGSNVGFDFILSGVQKDDLLNEIKFRMNALADKIRQQISGIMILVDSVQAINDSIVQINISINKYMESILIDTNNGNFITVKQ